MKDFKASLEKSFSPESRKGSKEEKDVKEEASWNTDENTSNPGAGKPELQGTSPSVPGAPLTSGGNPA